MSQGSHSNPFTPEIPQFANRDLSWLKFNERVLEQAKDPTVPLLERLRFLSIFSSNLDEFFMKRVGGFKRQIAAGVTPKSLDGLSPKQLLSLVRDNTLPMLSEQDRIFREEVRPKMREHGIHLVRWDELSEEEREYSRNYFYQRCLPLLTPLAVDMGNPFPFISNLSVSLGVALAHPERDDPLFARVKISHLQPRWILQEPSHARGVYRFLSTQELVLQHLAELYPDMAVLDCVPFRITRNAELDIDDEDDTADLLELIEEQLRQRRFGQVIRVEHASSRDSWVLKFVSDELGLSGEDIYLRESELDYADFNSILALEIPELTYERWTPTVPTVLLEEQSIFSIIRSRNILVHHPFESFAATVERFVREAATDPKVLALKMTVYRVGDETPIVPLLIKAAESGKQVVCLVELQARFDEERNMNVAAQLEEAGVHVMYGIPGLKTHAKTVLVVRQEAEGVQCYAHFGTGNYHAKTANLYTDLGFFTAEPDYTSELVHFFNYLTGRSRKADYRHLLIAPVNMEPRLLEHIEAEIEYARRGQPARIVAKMNSLEDKHLIRKLYEASSAGVQIDLIVRGICCLRPQEPGLSENIRVFSIIGRLLEHSRIYYFRSGATREEDGTFYLSSADWMYRNLHRRVELAVPVREPGLKERVWDVLRSQFEDGVLSWEMLPDGNYVRREDIDCAEASQDYLMRQARLLNSSDSEAGD